MTTSLIENAVNLLKAGKLVAFPTETVYGLGADASNQKAVDSIFAAKKRPKTHPLIVHIENGDQLGEWARDIPETAIKLADAFWPGPLTLVLPKQPWVLDVVTGHQDTIAIRIPKHPLALALLKAFGSGLAAPSANQFTHVSPTTAEAVRQELGNAVADILDGGPCEIGLESTIIDLSKATPHILRPGMITPQQLEQCLGKKIAFHQSTLTTTRVPGTHTLHYAPSTQTELLTNNEIQQRLNDSRELSIILITYDANSFQIPQHVKHFALSHHPSQYAHDLYETLRQADQLHAACILIQAVPHHSEWDAISDRIQKASGRKI